MLCILSNCSRRESGERGRPISNNNLAIQQLLLICHHLPNQYNTHSPTSSITLLVCPPPPPPFPSSNTTFPSLSTLQNSSNHALAPTILHLSTNCTCWSLSNTPQHTRKWATFSPTLLSNITYLLSLNILHLFLSSNTAETVLSLNSIFTLSWPCTDLTYLSTPVLSFNNLYHYNVLFVHTSFLAIILLFNLTNNPTL